MEISPKSITFPCGTLQRTAPVTDINAFTLISFVFITLIQHESAVVLWYTALQGHFSHWMGAAVASFVVISVIDLGWLYFLFFITDKSLHKLAGIGWIHRWMERLHQKSWFQKLRGFFVKSESESGNDLEQLHRSGSRFKRFVVGSGYLGMGLCASLPGPGLKEIGIIMALTPKYQKHGFKVMYFGGMVKTVMTMLVYGGLYQAVELLLQRLIS